MYQCWRPPQLHSKDLHSTIVAAFNCAAVWLAAHPYLLQDKECLGNVLEVVELGISGSKSVGKPGDPVKTKDEKELKPASMRVRDAAETLLTVILEQAGAFPSPCGPESLSSLLDEQALLRHCARGSTPANAVSRFRYFVLENSILLALLEEPLGNDEGVCLEGRGSWSKITPQGNDLSQSRKVYGSIFHVFLFNFEAEGGS